MALKAINAQVSRLIASSVAALLAIGVFAAVPARAGATSSDEGEAPDSPTLRSPVRTTPSTIGTIWTPSHGGVIQSPIPASSSRRRAPCGQTQASWTSAAVTPSP